MYKIQVILSFFVILFLCNDTFVSAATVTFQEGNNAASDFSQTDVVRIQLGANNLSGLDFLHVGTWTDDTPFARGLIKFTNMFGVSEGQIPYGASIQSAALTLTVIDVGTDPTSDSTHYVAQLFTDWVVDLVTWENFSTTPGGEIGTDFSNTPEDTFVPSAMTSYTIDVTTSVSQWAQELDENYGWIIYTLVSDASKLGSDLWADVSARPMLEVTYTYTPPPDPEPVIPEPLSISLLCSALIGIITNRKNTASL